ncbi:hypothetical protein RB213_010373 [Colletotrichum asianum]
MPPAQKPRPIHYTGGSCEPEPAVCVKRQTRHLNSATSFDRIPCVRALLPKVGGSRA